MILAGLLIGAGAAASWWPTAPVWVSIGCYLGATGLAIREPWAHARRSLSRRVLDINVLMVVAVAGALLLEEWFEAAMVVWLFGLSERLESRTVRRARAAIRTLMAEAPDTAHVRRGDAVVTVPAADVRPGDILVVRPGDRLPVDGTIVAGTSTLNMAPITGESWPVDVREGDQVRAGAINGHGAVDVRADRAADDSTIARMLHLVEEAQSRRAPLQTFVERFARTYTPAVVVVAAVVAVVPPLLLSIEALSLSAGQWSLWWYRALTLLVVACPCALVISTPVAMVAAVSTAARSGVLIKGGAVLERLAGIRAVAFDKTGTLTTGRLAVTKTVAVHGSEAELLRVAAALEVRSEHPIARAIALHASTQGLVVPVSHDVQALPGFGATGRVDASLIFVGSHRLFERDNLCTPALHAAVANVEATGASAVCVSRDGTPVGVIGLSDTLRPEAPAAVVALRAIGIDSVVVLTGDSRMAADVVHRGTQMDQVHAELLPEDKLAIIEALRREHRSVLMVGDGLNDTPALAAADVSLAMGAGAGAALETADATLLRDDLHRIPWLLRLGRDTVATIHINVGVALGLKTLFVALTFLGWSTLWLAVLADTGASMLVVANSLRLLRHVPGTARVR